MLLVIDHFSRFVWAKTCAAAGQAAFEFVLRDSFAVGTPDLGVLYYINYINGLGGIVLFLTAISQSETASNAIISEGTIDKKRKSRRILERVKYPRDIYKLLLEAFMNENSRIFRLARTSLRSLTFTKYQLSPGSKAPMFAVSFCPCCTTGGQTNLRL